MSDPAKPGYEPPELERPTTAMPAEETLERETPGGSREPARHDPYAAFRHANYRNYVIGNIISLIAMQMAGLTIGWELYNHTSSPTALGLVGLVQVVPIIGLALIAGQLIDKFSRKTIIVIDHLLLACSATALGLVSLFHNQLPDLAIFAWCNHHLASFSRWMGESNPHFVDRHIPVMFALLFLNGIIRAFNQPTKQSLLPQLLPPEVFPNAVTWNSSLFEITGMAGPALGGFLVALLTNPRTPDSSVPYATIYFINALGQLVLVGFFLPLKLIPMYRPQEPITLRTLLAGIKFVWDTKVIIATMTLDMFAVFLGGATALLPIYARDILHVGPAGFGWLRAAPSIGAFSMAILTAHLPPMKKAGRNLLLAVSMFGVATIIFGSTAFVPRGLAPTLGFAVAIVALFFTGAFDNVSVVVRHTLVQVLTPDHMRGRVSAVNSVFISSSNELGAMESGLTAAFFGPVASVIGGGVGTILVVLGVATVFPQIKRIRSLKEAAASVPPQPIGFPVEPAKEPAKEKVAT